MFTGIITDVGRVVSIAPGAASTDIRLRIGVGAATAAGLALGASVACSGVCLTAIALGPDWFDAEASAETASRTTLASWAAGRPINLERSLRLGDELGGHIVFGHVDGLARVVSIAPEGGSTRIVFELPAAFSRLVAPKGSIALDGVSLTVNHVDGARFGVNVIPHTRDHTTFSTIRTGDALNFEVDMLARYVARQLAQETAP